MAHPLPARPAFLPNPPEPTIPANILDSEPVAGPSTSRSSAHKTPSEPISTTACAICAKEPKYTCPGCTRRTCSLECSKAHKVKFECDGRRDATAFVPLKEVGHQTWADDYRWLEEGRRRIASWGEGIPRGALDTNRGRGGVRGRGRGRGGAAGARPPVDGRALGLGRELEKLGIGAQFMPEGMERRKKNQSSWNARTRALFLTVQLSVPEAILAGEDGKGIKTINHSRVVISPSSETKVTLQSLLPLLEEDTTIADLVFALPYHSLDPQPTAASGQRFFPLLDPSLPLVEMLRGTAFVEFPTVHVFPKVEWTTKLNNGKVTILPFHQARPEVTTGTKRKADDLETPRPVNGTAMPAPKPSVPLGLGLGDYASDGGESGEEAVEEATDNVTNQ